MFGYYQPESILNADETGIFYGASPANQYVPEEAAQSDCPDSDGKALLINEFGGWSCQWDDAPIHAHFQVSLKNQNDLSWIGRYLPRQTTVHG